MSKFPGKITITGIKGSISIDRTKDDGVIIIITYNDGEVQTLKNVDYEKIGKALESDDLLVRDLGEICIFRDHETGYLRVGKNMPSFSFDKAVFSKDQVEKLVSTIKVVSTAKM